MAPEPKWEIPPAEDPFHGEEISGDVGDLNGSAIGQELLPDLADLGKKTPGAGQASKPAQLEHVTTFEQGWQALQSVADDPAKGHHDIWNNIGNDLQAAHKALADTIDAVRDHFGGETATAVFGMADDSLGYLLNLVDAAHRMDTLVDTFSRDLMETRDWFNEKLAEVENAVNDYIGNSYLGSLPTEADVKEFTNKKLAELNLPAQKKIQTFYNPPIEWIGTSHPDMSAAPPTVGEPSETQPSSPGGVPGSPGGVPGGVGPGASPGMPPAASVAGPRDPAADQTKASKAPTDALKGATDAAKGAGDAAKKAGEGAQKAGQEGAKAAEKALGDALKANKAPAGGPPEGVLGLGPKGLNGAPKSGGAGGGRGAGAGGAGVRGPAAAKSSPQMAPPSKPAPAAPAASRAGVGSGAGSPGAGAPAAGQRGGGAGGEKVHKTSKALHHNKHGVVGEGEGVVPVVGDEPQESNPPKPTSNPPKST